VREIVTLAPLLVFVFWIGLAPKPFMNVMHASVAHLLDQVGAPTATGPDILAKLNLLP
jgi:NADH-quinone oxidoreductase subunit M